MKYRGVAGVYGPGSSHWVGDGFPVRNLFPSNGLSRQVDPFLMLDYAGPKVFPPSREPRGVEEHPHRGFETVTIAYQGSLEHRDSGGNSGVIHPGDVQWMTAASGVVHEEMHEREFTRQGGVFEVVQLWVNLPAAHKMSEPRYQTLLNEQIPAAAPGPGATVRVIAGALGEARGPARTVTPLNVWDLRLEAGASAELAIPADHNAAVVLLRGDLRVNGTAVTGGAQVALLQNGPGTVLVEAGAASLALVLSGQPIGEPVASYGPFVMNTEREIRQALEDYRAGRMGRLPVREGVAQ